MARRLAPLFALSACAIALATGCGDVYSDPASNPGQDFVPDPSAITPVAPPDVDASVSGPTADPALACPEAPLEGQACQDAGMTCEIGTSQDLVCDTTLECVSDGSGSSLGTWAARPSTLCPSYACPSSADAVASIDGTPCSIPQPDAGALTPDADELVCRMNDGTCACTTGVDGAHHHARMWVCAKPAGSCPVERPRAGSSCIGNDTCDYGSCSFKHGIVIACDGTAWRTQGATCK